MSPAMFYARLPGWCQDAVCSGYGGLLRLRRYSRSYQALEREVFSREFWDEQLLHHLVRARLQAIVGHAVSTAPYYRRLFDQLNLDPTDIRDPADMRALPILTKATVQENLREFHSETASRMRCTVVHTSGTTGAGLVFPMTMLAEREQWAVWWRYRARFGVDRSTWYAHFYGKLVVPRAQSRPPFWRVNLAGRQILFSAYHMCPRNLGFYVDELNRCRPPWIQGYPSLLVLLASFMHETGVRLAYRPDIVTTGAETLLPHQKHIIETAFGASCRQHYGLAEGVANISECPEGCLHVDEDYALVEFLPIGADRYRIIGTSFSNYAFPLLRYDTGDIAELSPRSVSCNCGRSGRVARSIDGRIEDYIVLPDGTKIGRLDHLFKDMINIKEAQILQDDPASVVFRIVRNSRYTERDEQRLLRDIRQRLGAQIKIRLSYVDAVERTDTQKLRFVISNLPEARLHPCKQR